MSNIMEDIKTWLGKDADMGSEDTTHPSAGADNQAEAAQTGSRASENESDVKAQVSGDSVNEASENGADAAGIGENSPVVDIGVKASPTGEDSSIETASAGSTVSDPGTTHPAKIDGGEKYASLLELGNSVLADIAVVEAAGGVEKKAADESPVGEAEEGKKEEAAEEKSEEKSEDKDKNPEDKEESKEVAEEKPASDEDLEQAKQAGAEAAAVLANAHTEQTQAAGQELIASVAKTAAFDGANVSDFLDGFITEKASQDDSLDEGSEEAVPAVAPEVVPEAPEVAPEGAPAAEEIIAELAEAGVSPEEAISLLSGAAGPEEAVEEEAVAEEPVAEEAMAGAGAEELPPELAQLMPAAEWHKLPTKEAKMAELRKAFVAVAKQNKQ